MQVFDLKIVTWACLVNAIFALGAAGILTGRRVSSYQTVMNRVVVPGGATQSVHVNCPAGKKVLSGGFNIETPDDIKIFSSDPSDGRGNLIDNGWNVMVHNTGTQGRQTTVVAICAQ